MDSDFNTGMIIDASHNGPVLAYLAKVGSATGPAPSSGWFKIYHDGLSGGQWAVAKLIANKGKFTVTIPSCIPPGDYVSKHFTSHNCQTEPLTHSSSFVVNSLPSTLPEATPVPSSTWSVLNSVSPAVAPPTRRPTTSPESTPAPTPGSSTTSTVASPPTLFPALPYSAAAEATPEPPSLLLILPHLPGPRHRAQLPHPAAEEGPLSSGDSVVVSTTPVLLAV